MRRRELILGAGAAAVWPFAARAQQADRMRRIGFLISGEGGSADMLAPLEIRAFVETLHKLGWVEGRNIEIIHRNSEGRRERLRENARQLVSLAPDVILTTGGIATADVLAETRTIPVVFAVVADPLSAGFVPSLSHPGGNATGFAAQEAEIGGKWLGLLKEIAPRLKRVLVLMQANSSPQRVMRDAVAVAAASIGLALVSAEARELADYKREIAAFGSEPDGGLVMLSNGIIIRRPEEVHALAALYRLPAIYSYPAYARTGGLISYGSDPVAQFPEAARYVDRILRGEKPGDLPVQQPTKFQLVINLKTAKALGLTVPPILLAQADEVIE